MSEPLTLPVNRQKESEGEKLLLTILIFVTIIYPGTLSVAVAAYIAQWTRTQRDWRAYGVLAFLSLVGLGFFWLTASFVYEKANDIAQAIVDKDLSGGVSALITLWGLGLPLAPLGGVLMSVWREVWQELYGQLRTIDEHLKRHVQEQERTQSAQSRRAARKAAHEPEAQRGELLLGAQVGPSKRLDNELGIVQRNGWIGITEEVLDTHLLVIGASGQGKTETLKRLIAEVLENTNRTIIFVDGKGDVGLAQDFAQMVQHYRGEQAPIFRLGGQHNGVQYNGFCGSTEAIYNRLCAMARVDTMAGGAAYYASTNALILYLMCHAPDAGPPRSFFDVEKRLDKGELFTLWNGYVEKERDIAGIKDMEILGLSRWLKPVIWQFEALIAPHGFSLEEGRSCLFSLKTGSVGYTADLLMRFILADITDFLGNRQRHDTQLFVDEFGVFGYEHVQKISTVLAQGRYAKLGAVLATQGPSGLGSPDLREQIIDTTGTKILLSMVNPEPIVSLAGTTTALELGQQIDQGHATGVGTVREHDQLAIQMNAAANLPRGEAYLIRKHNTVQLRIGLAENKMKSNQKA